MMSAVMVVLQIVYLTALHCMLNVMCYGGAFIYLLTVLSLFHFSRLLEIACCMSVLFILKILENNIIMDREHLSMIYIQPSKIKCRS